MGLMKHKLESGLLGEISITSDMQMTPPLWQRKLKSFLMKVKEESEKVGSKITADGYCSHEIKRHLLFGRKVLTNIDNLLKSRDTTLLIMVHIVKAMVFPVVKYGCESWTIKKAERQRIEAFELWCWRRLLRGP